MLLYPYYLKKVYILSSTADISKQTVQLQKGSKSLRTHVNSGCVLMRSEWGHNAPFLIPIVRD